MCFGASGFLVKEQGPFNLVLDFGTNRASFKTYEHQARKNSNTSTIIFYSILLFFV